jgi:hypothetical protein
MSEIALESTERGNANATAIRNPSCLRNSADAPIFPLIVQCCGTVLMAFLVVLRNPFLNVEMILAVSYEKVWPVHHGPPCNKSCNHARA